MSHNHEFTATNIYYIANRTSLVIAWFRNLTHWQTFDSWCSLYDEARPSNSGALLYWLQYTTEIIVSGCSSVSVVYKEPLVIVLVPVLLDSLLCDCWSTCYLQMCLLFLLLLLLKINSHSFLSIHLHFVRIFITFSSLPSVLGVIRCYKN